MKATKRVSTLNNWKAAFRPVLDKFKIPRAGGAVQWERADLAYTSQGCMDSVFNVKKKDELKKEIYLKRSL